MSEESSGLVFEPPMQPVPDVARGRTSSGSEAGWSSLREVGVWTWIRLLPTIFRSMLSRPEPVGGVEYRSKPVSEAAEVREVDFGDSAPTGDYTGVATSAGGQVEAPAAETAAAEQPVAQPVTAQESASEVVQETLPLVTTDEAEAVVHAPDESASEAVAQTGDIAVATGADAAEAVAEADEAGLS